jgi:UPF0716 family protein affecting phage T7 exclusion
MVAEMKRQAANVIVHSVGGVFIVAGIGAGFVPLVPGVVLIVIGLYIMSFRSAWLRSKLTWARNRFPRFDARVTQLESRFRSIKSKVFFWS